MILSTSRPAILPPVAVGAAISPLSPATTSSEVSPTPAENLPPPAASPFLSGTFYSWGLGALGVGLLAALGFLASRRIQ